MSFSVALPHDALKAFGHGLDALNKFGDEVNIDAKKEQLILWAVNSSITGQVVLRMSPKLFEKYTIKPSADSGNTSTSCRLLLKTLLKVFKSNQHRSSGIKQCELKLNSGSAQSRTSGGGLNGGEHRLYLKFVYENGMTKTNSLWYTDTDTSRPLFSKNMLYSFIIDPGVFADCIALMDNRIQDVSFLFTASRVVIKSFWEPSIGNSNSRPMQSQFKIPNHDFAYYNVATEFVLTFSMKELKTAVNYAIDTGDMLHAQFEEPGKPLIFTVEQRGFVIADFALMTFASSEGITQASGLTMNNNSITTEDSVLSVSKNSLDDLQRDQRSGTSTSGPRYSSPTPSASPSRHDHPQSGRSPSLEMLPPSFNQQKTKAKRNASDDSGDPLFPFGSPSASSRNEPRSSTPYQRQSSPQHHIQSENQPQHHQHHHHHHQHQQSTNTRQASTSDNDATTDEEEMFLVAPEQPKAKRRFFSD